MKNPAKLKLNAIACLLISFSLLSFPLAAQKKKSSNAGNKAYKGASYNASDAGQYMKKWLVAGPIMVKENSDPDPETQEKFFNDDPISSVAIAKGKPVLIQLNSKDFSWQLHASNENLVNLDALYKKDYAVAYAVAEVMADSAYNAFLAIGSDDAVKVWHNGKLVHKNWIARGLTPDDDIVPITLAKGSNQILIKIQEMAGEWNFTARLLEKTSLSDRLVTAAGRGNLDEINVLLLAGADINKVTTSGLSPVTAARMQGREDVEKLLLQKGAKQSSVPAPEKLIDGLYKFVDGKSASGISLLVAKDGKVLYKKGFGFADIENKQLISTETKFRIGSITKQFTAAAILKLQEENRLNISDKLSKYFPDFPRADEVTLHHLLTHTSGIHSYTGKSDFINKVTSPVTNDALLNYFKNDPYDFSPGEEWRYNNSGYFLLGYIIEKVSGKSYGQYLKETFFDPIQMSNTGVHTSTLKLTNEAKGYTKNENKYKEATNWDMSWAGGAGALYSTVEDLYKWNESLFNGKVLSEGSMKSAFTPVILNSGKTPQGINYGYGWGLSNYRGQEELSHSGGLHGFLSQLLRLPKENLTVVMLTNLAPAEVNLNPSVLAEFYLWDKMEKQPSYSARSSSGQDLKLYAGRYNFGNGAVMTITSEGDQLFAQLTGQQKFPVFASLPDEFFWKVVEAKIKFIKNEKGEVTHGEFAQGGVKMDVKRLPDLEIAKIDPAVYKDYTGKYDYGDNFVIAITTENGKIYAQGTNQPKLEILPLSEKEFTLKEVNGKIIFIRESDGKISKLSLDMGGQKKDAPKIE